MRTWTAKPEPSPHCAQISLKWLSAIISLTVLCASLHAQASQPAVSAGTDRITFTGFITGLIGLYGLAIAPTIPTPPSRKTVAKDFNGDGFADLVWENTSTGGLVIWLLKNCVYSSAINLPTLPTNWHIADH